MTNAPDSFNLDVRIRERLLKKRVITSATVESHLSGLKDAESDNVTLDLEQPALAKPPVVVAPVVQPVQPVRSSVADLPPPPPGLIKESPTPPYTPMVIENVPRDSSINGLNLSAGSAGASPGGASPGGASPAGASSAGASPAGASPAGASPAGASSAGAGVSGFGTSGSAELGQADSGAAEAAEADASEDEEDDLDDESADSDAEAGEPKGEGSVDDEWGG
jgi:hypothetical protein